MSLRVKLLITYFIGLIVSLAVLLLLGAGMIGGAIHMVATTFLKDQTFEAAAGRLLDLAVEIRHAERYEPERVTDEAFRRSVAEALVPFGGFLVVHAGGDYAAYGAPDGSNADATGDAAGTATSDAADAAAGAAGSEATLDAALLKAFSDESLPLMIGSGATFGDRFGQDSERDSHTTTWNGAEYLVLGYSFKEVEGSPAFYFLIDVSDVESGADRAGAGATIFFLVLVAIIFGPLLWVTTRDIILPLKDLERGARRVADGDLDFRLTARKRKNSEMGRVLTAFETMQTELRRSIGMQLRLEEDRKELVASISHDLKTPIASIMGYVEGIRDGVANTPEKLARYLDVVYGKSQYMDRLINDLFLFSKLDIGKEPFEWRTVEARALADKHARELEVDLAHRNVRFEADIRVREGTLLRVDDQKLARVLANIVGNSLKFMDKPDCMLTLTVDEDAASPSGNGSSAAGSVRFRIRDNGPGLPPETAEHVFERFYRGDAARGQDRGGTGLGLAIAAQIVAAHGGDIRAESVEGESTTIVFRLPVHAGPAE